MSNGNWIPDAVWDFIPPTGLAGGIFVGDREVLAVVVGNPNAATVNIEPINPSVIVPTVINFVATAFGAGTITYQWELDGVPIAGATTSVYDRTTVIDDDGKVITCKVTDGLGAQATSAPSTMTVALPVPPTITIAPIDPAVLDGDVIPFVATTTGTGVVVNTPTGAAAITLQWNLDGVPISGQQSSTYNRTTVLADNGKVITCTVTDTAGQSVESLPSTMTVVATVSYVSSNKTAANPSDGVFDCPMPVHASGDVAIAVISTSNGFPTLPTGWTNIWSTSRFRVCHIALTSGSTAALNIRVSTGIVVCECCIAVFRGGNYVSNNYVIDNNNPPVSGTHAAGAAVMAYTVSRTSAGQQCTVAPSGFTGMILTWQAQINVSARIMRRSAGTTDPAQFTPAVANSSNPYSGTIVINPK